MQDYHKINSLYFREGKKLVHDKWSCPEFEYLKDNKFEWTEKVDGTNIRVNVSRIEDSLFVTYGGRTKNAQIPAPLMTSLLANFGINNRSCELLSNLGPVMIERNIANITFYGEGYGPKIQKGEKYGDIPKFVVFDVLIGSVWLDRANIDDLCNKIGLDTVPIVGYGTLRQAEWLVAGEMESTWGPFIAEGLVVRPVVPMFDRRGNRIIAKIKYSDFV